MRKTCCYVSWARVSRTQQCAKDARARSGTIMQMRSCSDITARACAPPFHSTRCYFSFAHLPSRAEMHSFSRGRHKSCACAFVNVIWHLLGSACYWNVPPPLDCWRLSTLLSACMQHLSLCACSYILLYKIPLLYTLLLYTHTRSLTRSNN